MSWLPRHWVCTYLQAEMVTPRSQFMQYPLTGFQNPHYFSYGCNSFELNKLEHNLYGPSVFLPSTMCYMCASKNVPVVK